jgi:hypothetical protein
MEGLDWHWTNSTQHKSKHQYNIGTLQNSSRALSDKTNFTWTAAQQHSSVDTSPRDFLVVSQHQDNA